MPALDIREIAGTDAEAVAALWERCGLTRPWNDPLGDITFARSNGNSTILVGWRGETLAASVMVGHDGHRGTVYYVSVDPNFQKEGYGRELMDAAERWLRERGVWKLNLMVRESNTDVIEFYKALGYETEARVNMSKWLDAAKRMAGDA